MSKAKYTLWTIPRSAWSELPQLNPPTEDEINALTKFARTLDDGRLEERLKPFETPVTFETLLVTVP